MEVRILLGIFGPRGSGNKNINSLPTFRCTSQYSGAFYSAQTETSRILSPGRSPTCLRSQALGVDVKFDLVVERSDQSTKFIMANTGARVQHYFKNVSDHLSGSGYCLVCKKMHPLSKVKVDIRVFSPPCQPFSDMRCTTGGTSSTGLAEEHPQHNITTQDIPELTEADPALVTIIEQVPGIMKPGAGGKTPLQVIVGELESVYGKGHAAVVMLDSAWWIEGARERL